MLGLSIAQEVIAIPVRNWRIFGFDFITRLRSITGLSQKVDVAAVSLIVTDIWDWKTKYLQVLSKVKSGLKTKAGRLSCLSVLLAKKYCRKQVEGEKERAKFRGPKWDDN